ncbi:hypothetical protein [Microbacterium maritypicum]
MLDDSRVREIAEDLRRMGGGPNADACTPACPRSQHLHEVPWQVTVADAMEDIAGSRGEALAALLTARQIIADQQALLESAAVRIRELGGDF